MAAGSTSTKLSASSDFYDTPPAAAGTSGSTAAVSLCERLPSVVLADVGVRLVEQVAHDGEPVAFEDLPEFSPDEGVTVLGG